MTASHVVATVATIWLTGWWGIPFSIVLGLLSVYVWVGPWYLDDPDCVFAIRRETRWGNALSIFVNAFLGYILWPTTPLAFLWMLVRAMIYRYCYRIDFKVAFWAIFHDQEKTLPIPAAQMEGGVTS